MLKSGEKLLPRYGIKKDHNEHIVDYGTEETTGFATLFVNMQEIVDRLNEQDRDIDELQMELAEAHRRINRLKIYEASHKFNEDLKCQIDSLTQKTQKKTV